MGAACPFDEHEAVVIGVLRVARDRSAFPQKNSAATMSAADAQEVGWPLPASLVARTQSMRSRVATFFNAATRDEAWTGTRSGNLRKGR